MRTAGRSARRKARQLRVKRIKETGRWCLLAAAPTGVVTWAASGHALGSLAASAVSGGVTAAAMGRKPSEAHRWIQGAKGESRTARRLLALKGTGWGVAHDRSIPKSKANLDHVLIHPSGRMLVYVDTKAWHAKRAEVRLSGGKLMYGPWDQTKALETVKWEASKLTEHTGIPAVAVIACDQTKVANDGFIRVGDAYVVSSDRLVKVLRSMDDLDGKNKALVRKVKQVVDLKFPPAR